jgi:hypothetical protein
VDEALRGRLEAVRATLDEILQPQEVVSGQEEAAPRALDEDSAEDPPNPAFPAE